MKPLPCPFCGSVPIVATGVRTTIRCESRACPVEPSVTSDRSRRAVERWNTRAPITPPRYPYSIGAGQ